MGRFRTDPGNDIGEVVNISSCLESEFSLDRKPFGQCSESIGEFTGSMLKALEALKERKKIKVKTTYRDVMRLAMRNVHDNLQAEQTPHLTTSHRFEIDQEFDL